MCRRGLGRSLKAPSDAKSSLTGPKRSVLKPDKLRASDRKLSSPAFAGAGSEHRKDYAPYPPFGGILHARTNPPHYQIKIDPREPHKITHAVHAGTVVCDATVLLHRPRTAAAQSEPSRLFHQPQWRATQWQHRHWQHRHRHRGHHHPHRQRPDPRLRRWHSRRHARGERCLASGH